MELAIHNDGYSKVTASVYYRHQKQLKRRHTKIVNALREQMVNEKLINILEHYFKLEDERKGKGLCVQQIEYLNMITFELEQFIAEGHKEPAPRLFRLFMRINFNKEIVYRYYRDRLDELLEVKDVDTMAVLDQFSHKCSSPVRGDVSYNWQGNQLRADMLIEIETRRLRFRKSNEDFKPIHFDVTSTLLGAIIFASIESSLIVRPSNKTQFFHTLSRVFRRPDGTSYKETTFKNAITDVEDKHVEEAKEMLAKMDKALDERLKFLKK